MGNAFLYRMPSGIPGDVSRKSHSTIEAHILGGQLPAFGVFGQFNVQGQIVALDANTKTPYGLLVRAYPTQSATNALGAALPPSQGISDVLVRGYMTVKNNAGTAKKGQPVYTRIANATDLKPLGGIEAIAVDGETIEVKAIFMCEADANGNVEIAFNI